MNDAFARLRDALMRLTRHRFPTQADEDDFRAALDHYIDLRTRPVVTGPSVRETTDSRDHAA